MAKLKTFTLEEVKDEIIGKRGTPAREEYERELQLDIIGDLIKRARKEKNLTQAELGEMVGVQKSWISKLEKNASHASMETIFKVLKAMDARIMFTMQLGKDKVQIG